MDTFKKIEDIAENFTVEPRFAMRSITSQAAKSIYYFPILCSRSVDPKTAAMISKNLEHAYMTFVQACFALTPAVTVKGDHVDVEDYLKRFHQNIGIKSANDLFLAVTLKEAVDEFSLLVNDALDESMTDKEINKVLSEAADKTKDKISQNPYFARLKDIDAKKVNSLTPSVVRVLVTFLLDGEKVDVEIPVGVKTIVHPVDTEELSKQIMDSVSGRGMFHNIVRYTTGEIMSLKDIIFGISKMKNNVSRRRTSTVAKWFDIVDHRKRLNKFRWLSGKPFLPNVTIHISMEDINEIQRHIGYNLLTDTARAAKFIKDNFLLSLIITDDATDTAYILYDGHTDYEEYPYASMKRENEKVNDEINALIKGLGVGMKMS